MTEEELIKGVIKGERSHQKQLYQQYAGKMFYVCLRYLKDRDEAEDALQEAFIKVFTYVNNFKFQGSFEGWIRRIVVHTSIEQLRKHNQKFMFQDIEEVSDYEPIENEAIPSLNERELLKMIHLLPDGYKTVFNMYAIEGYSHKEIAETLGITEGTSKSQLAKARAYLKELLYKHLDFKVENEPK